MHHLTTRCRRALSCVAAAASAGALVLAAAPAAGAGTTGAPTSVSRIRSAAQHTCLDVSTTDPAKYFLDTYGHPCDGSVTQAFSFRPLPSAPAGTYEIVSRSTGACMDQYRQGIRQESCVGRVPPDYTNAEWTLDRVGTSGNRYRILVTSTATTSEPSCVTVSPRPHGYPGPTFLLQFCSGSASQVVDLQGAP